MAKSKSARLRQNFTPVIEQFVLGRSFEPMTAAELCNRLRIPDEHRKIAQRILDRLVREDVVEKHGGRYARKQQTEAIITGTISVHPRGFGFVKPASGTEFTQDIFIPKHQTKNAVDGDTVEVVVERENVSEKGPEGYVLAIVERGRTHIAGIISEITRQGTILAYVPLFGKSERVVVTTKPGDQLSVGDRVVLHVTEWGDTQSEIKCEISHILGHISDPSVDISAAIEEFEIRYDFPQDALLEARLLGKRVTPTDIKGRKDLRKLNTVTIDPTTAKDFDDALSIRRLSNGQYRLWVHIADVSHYVTPGSNLDREASQRCNSTYFPGECVPMLPPGLSEQLCSLRPMVNRLTVTVEMLFSSRGELKEYDIYRSVIRSNRRFTYEEAWMVLQGEMTSRHKKSLKWMVELCNHLKRIRRERGSLEFALPEAVICVDKGGVPHGIEWVEYDITHQLVEEFMLKANEVVATHLTEEGMGLSYRIHEEPATDDLEAFAVMARTFGFKVSDIPTPEELQELFEEAAGTPYAQHLAIAYIRCMRLAIYSAENLGHYGLGLEHYCHFTSPIRRYVDLVVHRTLFEEPMDAESLAEISDKCSQQERISARAEQAVKLLKKLRLLAARDEEDPSRQYEAVITSVKPFGVFFDVSEFMLEGFVHISQLGVDYYYYEERQKRLVGEVSGETFQCGDPLTVMVQDLDLITLECEWSVIPETTPEPKKKKNKPKKKSGRKRTRRKR